MSRKKLRSHCPINFVLEAFGDKWTLLVLRDIVFRGKSTYGEFLKSEEGFATNILATRLEHLEAEHVLQKIVDPADARRSQYMLTEKGLDLIPILFEMMVWSEKYDPKSEARLIPRLMGLIKNDNHKISEKAKERLRRGLPLFPEYLG
ncbi:helix-turn-helix domain-containing protein [Bdellovibrio sp. NC01]|uniref:winged helix-turn-helix transcriptional regulator n=1 Tax=Bdellovibrio sp. NC01 TaxID=2220073 RepID=UPI001157A81D|nr:helix-turn-helix domain-containing protein [Bdellovibrio sp. NC01]QDK39359.1 transcriptional regulator [Bdellovibrio sp. NC01]